MSFESPNPMKVGVPGSSTDYGSKNGGGKVKFKPVAALPVDRNSGGGAGAKRNSGMNSK